MEKDGGAGRALEHTAPRMRALRTAPAVERSAVPNSGNAALHQSMTENMYSSMLFLILRSMPRSMY